MPGLYYPIALRLKGRQVLIAGGGKVAERKIKTLLKCGASVRVTSPDLVAGLRKLADSGRIRWLSRRVKAADVRRADIVIAATSDAAVNKKISRWSEKRRILVNVVDKPGLSDFISPAILTAGPATVAVYTNGKDPVLSRDLKNFLKEHWDVFLSYRNRL